MQKGYDEDNQALGRAFSNKLSSPSLSEISEESIMSVLLIWREKILMSLYFASTLMQYNICNCKGDGMRIRWSIESWGPPRHPQTGIMNEGAAPNIFFGLSSSDRIWFSSSPLPCLMKWVWLFGAGANEWIIGLVT